MANQNVKTLIQGFITQIAAAADDQFEFDSLLDAARRMFELARHDQVLQNEGAKADAMLVVRAARLGKPVETLKAELAAEIGLPVDKLHPAQLLAVITGQPKIPDPPPGKP